MRGWKGGRATLQYHLLDDGVAWGFRYAIHVFEVLSILLIVLAHTPCVKGTVSVYSRQAVTKNRNNDV